MGRNIGQHDKHLNTYLTYYYAQYMGGRTEYDIIDIGKNIYYMLKQQVQQLINKTII